MSRHTKKIDVGARTLYMGFANPTGFGYLGRFDRFGSHDIVFRGACRCHVADLYIMKTLPSLPAELEL